MMRTGLVVIELTREGHDVTVKTRGFMPERDFRAFVKECASFGTRYDTQEKARVVERARAGVCAAFLRQKGFSVKLARSLEDPGTAGALSLRDLIDLAAPLFKADVHKHVLDFAAMGPSALADQPLSLLQAAEAAVGKVATAADPRFPTVMEETDVIFQHLRAALAARQAPTTTRSQP